MNATVQRVGLLDVYRCPDCGDPVIRAGQLTLDADATTGGRYEIRGELRIRRGAWVMAEEWAARQPVNGGGHEPHRCADPQLWYLD